MATGSGDAAAAPAGPGDAAGSPSGVSEAALQMAIAKQVAEGRKKFYAHLEDTVLDYFHCTPAQIEACLNTCIKVFGNVVQHPEEEKYRKIKASSQTLRSTVAVVKGGEDLLLHAGWLPKVVAMEKHWVFDAPEGHWRFGVLKEALHLCEKSLATVHEKVEKVRKEREAKLGRETAEKERVRLALEEDKAERKERLAMQAAAAAAVRQQ